MNASMTPSLPKCDQRMLPSPIVSNGKGWWIAIHAWHIDHCSTCGIHCAKTSHFPRCLVRTQNTLAGQIATFVATSIHKMPNVQTPIAVVGTLAPLWEVSAVSSLPALMAFTHYQTVSHGKAWVPILQLMLLASCLLPVSICSSAPCE